MQQPPLGASPWGGRAHRHYSRWSDASTCALGSGAQKRACRRLRAAGRSAGSLGGNVPRDKLSLLDVFRRHAKGFELRFEIAH